MFELFEKNTKEEIAKRLGTDAATLTAFEESYKAFETPSDKLSLLLKSRIKHLKHHLIRLWLLMQRKRIIQHRMLSSTGS